MDVVYKSTAVYESDGRVSTQRDTRVGHQSSYISVQENDVVAWENDIRKGERVRLASQLLYPDDAAPVAGVTFTRQTITISEA